MKTYLQDIKDLSPQDKEHSRRTQLENFLNRLKDKLAQNNKELLNLHVAHEPNNDKEGRGAPDFLIQNQGLVVGYIENKRVNADLDSLLQSPQIEKYLSLSDNLMLTDYLRFCIVRKSEKGKAQIIKSVRICEFDALKSIAKSSAGGGQILEAKTEELQELFKLFFSHSPKPINTALEFANSLALRTRILKDELLANKDNEPILNVYNDFKNSLYKELEFEIFADSFAQTLTYSLFLARLNNDSNKEIDLYNAKKFIPKNFPLIRAMSGFLEELEDLDSIKWLLKEILNIISHINITSIILDLNKAIQKDLLGNYFHKDPYLHFYETFLSQYDPKMREIRGVYYTPAPVVSFIINAIDSTLKTHFALKEGLSDAVKKDSNITLLDFATGTGTFLLEAFRKALESIRKNNIRYEPKALLSKFFGFEFLISPYTIAHLKLSQSFKEEFNASLEGKEERLGIYLTNTLYYKDAKQEQAEKSNLFVGNPELLKEALEAQNTKEKPILIITGNPPYSGASANKGLFEDNVRITYGLEPSEANLSKEEQENIRLYLQNPKNATYKNSFKAILERKKLKNEKNPKWLLDDYVKFICFAESKIKAQHSGIFAFISNNSFLDNPTFRGMRYSLLKTFDAIYILDLHGNVRKKETTPSGEIDQNVFDIMQGVSINIFVKNKNSSLGVQCDKIQDFSQGTDAKSANLAKNPENLHSHTANTRICDSNPFPCHSEPALAGEESQPITSPSCAEGARGWVESQNLAQIYHYDLQGKRGDKYDFLLSNTLDSIKWNKLKPKAPFYLFIPQNEDLRAEYEKGWSVKDIFRVSNTGIVTKRDNLCIQKTKEKVWEAMQDILNLEKNEFYAKYKLPADVRDWRYEWAKEDVLNNNSKDKIQKIAYRPFDTRYIFYSGKSRGFVGWPVPIVSEHFLQGGNCAISIPRQLKDTNKEWNHCMPTQNITDQALSSGGNGPNTIMPLYLKNTESTSTKKGKKDCHSEALAEESHSNKRYFAPTQYDNVEWVENFTQEFREFIDSKYQWEQSDYDKYPHFFKINSKILSEKCGLQEKSQESCPQGNDRSDFSQLPHLSPKAEFILTPEAILGYIYAVLFHKTYREKYIDFLKIDFPKIPFVESKEKFLALSALGEELIAVHLMQDGQIRERERERERTENDENGLQYRVGGFKENDYLRGLEVGIYKQHNSGTRIIGRQQGRREYIPSLSLPKGLNMGLVCDRGCKLQEVNNIFITQNIIDLHLVGSGSYVFPLYLYKE